MTREQWQAKWYAKSALPGRSYKIDEAGARATAQAELRGIVGAGDHIELTGTGGESAPEEPWSLLNEGKHNG